MAKARYGGRKAKGKIKFRTGISLRHAKSNTGVIGVPTRHSNTGVIRIRMKRK